MADESGNEIEPLYDIARGRIENRLKFFILYSRKNFVSGSAKAYNMQ